MQYSPTARLRNTSRYTEISVDFNATQVQGSLFYLSDGETSGVSSIIMFIREKAGYKSVFLRVINLEISSTSRMISSG